MVHAARAAIALQIDLAVVLERWYDPLKLLVVPRQAIVHGLIEGLHGREAHPMMSS